MDFFEHGAGGLVEILVERPVASRAQAPERFDRRSYWRKRILDLVRNAAGDFAPRGYTIRRSEPVARRFEIEKHRVEGVRELCDFTGAADL
jgi:hypothetical protein